MDEIHPHIDAIAATENDSNNKNRAQILIPETERWKRSKIQRELGELAGTKFQEQELPHALGTSSEQPQLEFVGKMSNPAGQMLPLC